MDHLCIKNKEKEQEQKQEHVQWSPSVSQCVACQREPN